MKKYFWLAAILVLGIVLRFYHNTDISLWHDEAFSALLIKYPWGEMMHRIGLDVHPPMYYIFLRLWHYLFGDSLLALRSYTVFFSAGTVFVAYGFVKEAFKNEKAALWAALLIAINPFQLQYATEARMYTMGAFFAVLAAFFVSKALRFQHEYYNDEKLNIPNFPRDISLKRKALWHYFGFAISVIILIYTHYYLLFTAAAICFYALIYHIYHYRSQFRRYWLLLLSFIVIVISYFPWLKTFLFQYKQVQGGYWIPHMDKWSIPTTVWKIFIGTAADISKSSTQIFVVLGVVFALYFLYKFLRKTQSFEKWLVVLCLLAPFAGAVLFALLARLKGSDSSVYLERYFLYTAAFFSIALAVWLKEIHFKWLSVSLLVAYATVNLFAFGSYWSDINIKTRPGMNGASKFLEANVEPSHKLYVGSSFMFFNLKYYISQFQNATNFPKPLLESGGNTTIANMPHFAGTAILVDADLLPRYSEGVRNGDTVWIVWTNGFGANKPEVPANWTRIDERVYPEVRPYLWANVYVSEYKVN